MKGSAKPISSPGRTEKFPPPLMRFLKSNVGNKSRGRTRASPMFMRKNNDVALETTQEPSSPKVTCIGQVRARRSSKSTATTRRPSSTRKKQQKKEKKSCCFNIRWKKLNIPKSLVSVLKKWVRCYCGKRVETVDSSLLVESSRRVQSRVSITTENVATTTNAKMVTENEEGFVGLDSNSNNPPKNALLLTRCRSAPYRSSSLASRLWGSPSESQMHQNNVRELAEKPVLENPISPGSRRSHESEEMQSSTNSEEEKNGGGAYVHPLLLTRCKSEPARTGERLNPTRFTDELHPQS
ncbi:hypothetical protein K7X08_015750 [Anisodus acutangulus]|uniref:Uncharacterized protein n=1 Tax=Anisodus acutangulus TaxID=402998 RepID=A0A9Q1LCA3_9SOLA|nr:hypothetical protein K7X08_015750 [Anisodus acutangulus]